VAHVDATSRRNHFDCWRLLSFRARAREHGALRSLSQTFGSAGNLVAARQFHSATLLRDGRVLIKGGGTQYGPPSVPFTLVASAELYTPALPIPAPALFSLSRDGQGQGGIWHPTTGVLASAANPAVAGEILSLYTTPDRRRCHTSASGCRRPTCRGPVFRRLARIFRVQPGELPHARGSGIRPGRFGSFNLPRPSQ
jgi:hypothetical protein